MVHCNMYRHLSVRQLQDVHYRSSLARHARLDSRAAEIKTEEEVRYWLGDQQGELPVFRTEKKEKDVLVTLATGYSRHSRLYILTKAGFNWLSFFGEIFDFQGSFFHFSSQSVGN